MSARTRTVLAVALDVAVAAVCAWLAVTLTLELPGGSAPAAVLAAVHGGVLVARRRAPRAVMVAVLLTAVAYVLSGPAVYRLGPAALVATYSLAARCDRRTALAALAALLALLAAAPLTGDPVGADSALQYALMLGGSWLLGDVVHRAQTAAREHARRADELARARTELAQQAVARERLRIARELHDVVAHAMSVIAVHAGSGRLAAETDPAVAREALAVIEKTSRGALDEMRRLLSVLRQDGDAAGALTPAPGLADLHTLVSEVVSAGVTVDVRVDGDAALPAAVDLCAYRIVQEALTNVLRHARATRAEVVVVRDDGRVTIEVSDDGAGGTAEGNGHGTVGMRERAALFGGTVRTGPRAGGGWSVRATLPFGRAT